MCVGTVVEPPRAAAYDTMVDDVTRNPQLSECVLVRFGEELAQVSPEGEEAVGRGAWRFSKGRRVEELRLLWVRLRRFLFAILVGVQLLSGAGPARAQDYTADRAAGDELTAYLRRHHLPLVSAEVLKTTDGDERVVLYGFVASDFGKGDAKIKALEHIGKKGIPVENRIVVRPEIGRLKSSRAAGASVKEPGNQANESLDQVIDEIQRFGVKSPPGEENLGNP